MDSQWVSMFQKYFSIFYILFKTLTFSFNITRNAPWRDCIQTCLIDCLRGGSLDVVCPMAQFKAQSYSYYTVMTNHNAIIYAGKDTRDINECLYQDLKSVHKWLFPN